MGGARALIASYRRFAEGTASPLHRRVALALSGSEQALRALQAAPAARRRPALILSALHDLALAGRAPALAAAYAAGDGDAAGGAAIDTLLEQTDPVVALAVRRRTTTLAGGHCAVLYPAVAEAARRAGATSVGLISVGSAAGLDLSVDRVGIAGSNGQRLGDTSSPVQQTIMIRGPRPLPGCALPEVVARVSVEAAPFDVTDANDVRWLRACVEPDAPERAARLRAELALAAALPPLLLAGDAVELLPEALAQVPSGALPVVTTTWALSRLPLGSRQRFVRRLVAAAADRTVAWVSVEGVGVAPGVPTLGDRPASGHSLVGVAVFGPSTEHAEAVGRCWSRGSRLEWLADS